jgi:hypothetical protein
MQYDKSTKLAMSQISHVETLIPHAHRATIK